MADKTITMPLIRTKLHRHQRDLRLADGIPGRYRHPGGTAPPGQRRRTEIRNKHSQQNV